MMIQFEEYCIHLGWFNHQLIYPSAPHTLLGLVFFRYPFHPLEKKLQKGAVSIMDKKYPGHTPLVKGQLGVPLLGCPRKIVNG